MRQVVRSVVVGALLTLLTGLMTVGTAAFALGPDAFMPLSEVQPGMEGVGKTVVGGDTIDSFHVRVVDVIDNPGPFNYILVRVSGGAITAAGGVASGMSGSPVYIDGKLAGAMRATALWQTSDEPMVWLTPIESMLELVERVQRGVTGQPGNVDSEPPSGGHWDAPPGSVEVSSASGLIEEIRFVSTAPTEAELGANPHRAYVLDMHPVLLVGGLSERPLSWLRQGLSDEPEWGYLLPEVGPEHMLDAFLRGIREGLQGAATGAPPSPGGGVAQGEPDNFVAGGPMGALLMTGDLYYGWSGTVTFTQDVDINGETQTVAVGLAHPALGAGDVHYFLSPVAVLDTVATQPLSFKLSVPIGIPEAPLISGVVAQDRDQGVAALLDAPHQAVRLKFSVVDLERAPGVNHTYAIDVAPMARYFPFLTLIAGYQSVYSTLNRIGEGTMWVRYTIRGEGLPRAIVREDVFATVSDVGLTGPLQLARVAYLLAWNEFADVQITDIDVEIEVTSKLHTVIVKGIQTEEQSYRPGDEVDYVVALQPHHGEPGLVAGTLTLPETAPEGELTIWAVPAQFAEWLIAYADFGWMRPMESVYELDQLIEQVETSSKGDRFYVFLEGMGCLYIECQDPEERQRVRHTHVLEDYGLEGSVTGIASWTILVTDAPEK